MTIGYTDYIEDPPMKNEERERQIEFKEMLEHYEKKIHDLSALKAEVDDERNYARNNYTNEGWHTHVFMVNGQKIVVATDGNIVRVRSRNHNFVEFPLVEDRFLQADIDDIDHNQAQHNLEVQRALLDVKSKELELRLPDRAFLRLPEICPTCLQVQPVKISTKMPNGDIYKYKGCCETQYLYSINDVIQPIEFNGAPYAYNQEFITEDEMEI